MGFSCCVLLALFIASRASWHPFNIPSGSMKPNLLPGDYLIAMRALGRPERGEVILFRHPATADIYIKRLVAMSGDSVQMVDGVLHLNGEAMAMSPLPDWVEARGPQGPLGLTPRCTNPSVEETCVKGRMLERLPNGRSYAVLGIGEQPYENTSVTDLPEGYLFVLGDNCDNALHSRIAPVSGGPGLVPEENVVWRPSLVVFSSTDAAGRFLRWVH
ncbi:MAG: signal peptidase I [Pseudomonadota bacterium]